MTGFAVLPCVIPPALHPRLAPRLFEREGKEEYQFCLWHDPPQLPVEWHGRIHLLRWGCQRRRSPLPYGGYVSVRQVRDGLFAHVHPEPVVVPAYLAFQGATWVLVKEGVRGVVLPEVPGGPVVYLLCEPSSNYYKNMCSHSETMPLFVNQVL